MFNISINSINYALDQYLTFIIKDQYTFLKQERSGNNATLWNLYKRHYENISTFIIRLD
jgi:hypothetical protein